MPIEQCCVTPAEMWSLYYASNGGANQVVYTVPANKVFVLTAWTLININNQITSVWLRRGTTKIAFNRIWDTVRNHNHLDLDPGVPFAAGDQLVIEGANSWVQNMFYGYEQDV
jgi:hypothetical protein